MNWMKLRSLFKIDQIALKKGKLVKRIEWKFDNLFKIDRILLKKEVGQINWMKIENLFKIDQIALKG